MACPERLHKYGLSRAPKLLVERPRVVAGVGNLRSVNIHESQLADGARSHVPDLGREAQADLLLERQVPGLDIAAVQFFRLALESHVCRYVDDAIPQSWRSDRRKSLGKRGGPHEAVGRRDFERHHYRKVIALQFCRLIWINRHAVTRANHEGTHGAPGDAKAR